jgi:glycosyltransferase involved in cell wall biosynthesis
MSAPLVSVLTPCYNAAPWLEATVASVRAQTWRNYEIILVDDGSTDDTLALARRLAGPDVKVLHQPNSGQCSAFNAAFRQAQGDFIEYLDADDLLHPRKLEVQLARLAALPPGWIASGAWARFHRDPAEAEFRPEKVWRDLAPVDWLVESWSGGGMMHGAAWLAPRAIAAAAGPWDERLSLINDFDFFTRVLLASQGVAFCPEARSYYRSGLPGSLSGSTSRRAWESAFLSTTLGTKSLLSREDSSRTRSAAAINWQRFVYSAYPQVPDLVTQAEAEVRSLGGCELELGGGTIFQLLRRALGWKLARRAQVLGRRLRHPPSA